MRSGREGQAAPRSTCAGRVRKTEALRLRGRNCCPCRENAGAGGTGVPALPVSWVSELNDAVRGAPGRIRTCDLPLRRRMLCPLSYWSLRQV